VSRALWVTFSVIFASLLLYLVFVGHREQVARMTSAFPDALSGLTRLVERLSLPSKNQATDGRKLPQTGKPGLKTPGKTANNKDSQPPDISPGLVLSNINYGANGELVLTGKSQPGADLEFFIDGVEIEQARMDVDGSWKLVVPDRVPAGPHKLEVSVAAKGPRPRTIVVLPFVKAGPEEIAALALIRKRVESEKAADDLNTGSTTDPAVKAPEKPVRPTSEVFSKLAELARSQSVKNDVDPMAGLFPRLIIGEGPELVMPQTDPVKGDAPKVGKQRQKVKTSLVGAKDARGEKPVSDNTALSKAEKKVPYTSYRKVTVAPGKGLVVVQPGNTLWDLAISIYGSGNYYLKLYRANRCCIRNPQMIFPGQIIFAPGANPPTSIEPLSAPQWLPPQ